jgi:hypothetical protein
MSGERLFGLARAEGLGDPACGRGQRAERSQAADAAAGPAGTGVHGRIVPSVARRVALGVIARTNVLGVAETLAIGLKATTGLEPV